MSNEDLVEKSAEETIEQPVTELVEEQIEKPEKESTENQVKESEELGEESEEESKEELVGEQIDDPVKDLTKEPIKKVIKGIIISACILLAIYFGMTKYFTNHFYIGSTINSISVSGKSIEDAKEAIAAGIQNYTLNLKEHEGKSEQIKASDVGLKINSNEELSKLKDRQNPFKWPTALFTSKNCKMDIGLSYDEKQLKEKMNKLSCINSDNIVEPQNVRFQYENSNYVMISEVLGNKVDKDVLYYHIVNSILKGENEIDLELAGCYIKPKYDSKSEKAVEVKNLLNKYISSKITYTFDENKEVLDGSIINKWLKVDDDFQIVFDKKKMKAYIDTLWNTYNTSGKTRKFITSSGETIYIDGGDYGRYIDETKEVESLIKDIQEGKTLTKEPVYSSRTVFAVDDGSIGDTYVEIDLSKQHLWFYKNGVLITQGDVVTGNASRNYSTPKGIYRLKYKARNTILRGPGYAVFVSYWMPFNNGIGIHDANWRSVFGGSIYKNRGSHGCVNTLYDVAHMIYDNIEVGTPIVCY